MGRLVDGMKEYREQLEIKLNQLKEDFEEQKRNLIDNLENATPNQISQYTSTYGSGLLEITAIAGKIKELQEQIRAFDYYNK